MRTISEMLEAAQRTDIQFLIENSLMDSREDYVKLQKEQMMLGFNEEDEKIGRYRNDRYAQMKYAQSSLAGYGNVDLRLKGPFQAGIFMDVRSDIFIIDSLDSKTDDLLKRYSEKIFGLGPTRLPEFIEVVQPRMITSVEKSLNRGM